MKRSLLESILMNDKPVRELIDEACAMNEAEEPDVTLGDEQVNDDEKYRHLFVRRWHEGDEKPYKRVKCESAGEALKLYFDWLLKYKRDKVEIWTDVAQDAKNFYRFCLVNRDPLAAEWKSNIRQKKVSAFPPAFRDIQVRSRQSGNNLTGTLYPFTADAQ